MRTLQAKVTDLQENEEQIVQKAEVFRETLQATVSADHYQLDPVPTHFTFPVIML